MLSVTCDMHTHCANRVACIDVKGWAYCADHEPVGRRYRRLRKWEVRALERGETISYRLATKTDHDARISRATLAKARQA